MIYRKLDANGDRQFGHGLADFFQNEPAAVGQAVDTRLGLFLGEFFLDVTDGTDWLGAVLGVGTTQTYDAEVTQRILGTQGLLSMPTYASVRDPNLRSLSIVATIDTVYGAAEVATNLLARSSQNNALISPPIIPIGLQPTELMSADGTTELLGADGSLLFDPRLPLP